MARAKLGTGARFKSLTKKLSAKGAKNPKALAAYIGRKKFGTKKFTQLSVTGRRDKGFFGHMNVPGSIHASNKSVFGSEHPGKEKALGLDKGFYSHKQMSSAKEARIKGGMYCE